MRYRFTPLIAITLCSALTANASDAGAGMAGCMQGAASAPMGGCPAHMNNSKSPQGRWGADYTPGWMLMTPEERKSFADKMRSARSREECQAIVEQQRGEVVARAKATGQRLPHQPRHSACMAFPKNKAEAHTHRGGPVLLNTIS